MKLRHAILLQSPMGQQILTPNTIEDSQLDAVMDNLTAQLKAQGIDPNNLRILTDLDIIHAPSGYKVGNTSEDYKNTSFGNYGKIPSWCDLYDNLLGNLSSQYAQMTDLQIFRRKGMSVRRKWCRDLY